MQLTLLKIWFNYRDIQAGRVQIKLSITAYLKVNFSSREVERGKLTTGIAKTLLMKVLASFNYLVQLYRNLFSRISTLNQGLDILQVQIKFKQF
jgi:hypothetical protein